MKEAYAEFESGREGEPDFRWELGAENLGGAVEEAETERRGVADFDSQFALFVQFELPHRRRRCRTRRHWRTHGSATERHNFCFILLLLLNTATVFEFFIFIYFWLGRESAKTSGGFVGFYI